MKTKKKATIFLLLGIIVVVAVVCGLVIPHNAIAEESASTVNTGTYKYKTSYIEVKYPSNSFEKEGYDSIQDWCQALKDTKEEYNVKADEVKSQYEDFLSEESYNLIQEYSEKINKCTNFTDMESYKQSIQLIIDECEQAKLLKEQEEAEALAAQAAQQAASYTTTTNNVNYSGATTYAATSSSWSDAASAKAFIVGKESGGSYTATNGRYYGAYQLDSSYLNGDYSAENQDRVAENYVNNRYGGWEGAAAFWQSHGWY